MWRRSLLQLQRFVQFSLCVQMIFLHIHLIFIFLLQVSWSHTYTRPGYAKRQHHSVPRDWWTEDISDLDLDLFRCVITAARSTFTLQPQLIGEALHVYTCRWLPYFKSNSHSGFSVKENEAALERHRRVVNTVVNMIPADKGSVSEGFLLRLVSIASYVGASLTTKTELIRKAGLQLEEANLEDLLLRSHSSSHHHRYDTDLVATVLESFLMLWRRQSSAHVSSNNSQLLHSIRKVAKLIDSYLQAVAQDVHMSFTKFLSLAEAVPDIARESHDRLYKAINIYLKVSEGQQAIIESHTSLLFAIIHFMNRKWITVFGTEKHWLHCRYIPR